MSRKSRGKLKTMTPKDKLAKRVRNEKRKRDNVAVRWEKEHVVREGFKPPPRKPTRRRREQEAMTAAIAEAVRAAAEDGMPEKKEASDGAA